MNKYITYKIDFQLLLWLILSFIFFTIIGTISHEFGHYLAAKYIGLDAKVHYGYTRITIPDDFSGVVSQADRFLLTLGGPLQTIFTGVLGLFLLYINRKRIKSLEKLKTIHWIYVLLSLFWLRQTANFVMWIRTYFIRGRFSKSMDEIKLARNLEMHEWSIIFPTAVLGFLITVYVIFRYIPLHQRFTFVLSGLIGGASGYYLWLESLGKIIMP